MKMQMQFFTLSIPFCRFSSFAPSYSLVFHCVLQFIHTLVIQTRNIISPVFNCHLLLTNWLRMAKKKEIKKKKKKILKNTRNTLWIVTSLCHFASLISFCSSCFNSILFNLIFFNWQTQSTDANFFKCIYLFNDF